MYIVYMYMVCIANNIFFGVFVRDSAHEISLIDSFKKELAPSGRHVLNIHELEAYNKVG